MLMSLSNFLANGRIEFDPMVLGLIVSPMLFAVLPGKLTFLLLLAVHFWVLANFILSLTGNGIEVDGLHGTNNVGMKSVAESLLWIALLVELYRMNRSLGVNAIRMFSRSFP